MAQTGGIESVTQSANRAVEAPDLRDRPSGGDKYDKAVLPADCPLTPLGIQGLKLHMLDSSQQLVSCDTRLTKNDMVLLFGGSDWLTEHFPQFPKPSKDNPKPEPNGFDQKYSSEAVVIACHRKGIWNPQGRVFGRGAHRVGEMRDQLALHIGDGVLIAGAPDKKGRAGPLTQYPAGEVADNIYPASEALPSPAMQSSTPEDGRALLDLFRRWYWVERDAAPLLLLGMCAQMHICGALEWRSHIWLAGPTASGKSSLQALIRAIHSYWCLQVEDASEAAIRQILGDDTLPVMIDEAEADDNPEKQRAIMNLAKKASSGAKIIRGGADHKGQEFTAQSCFLFSSVLHSLVKGEERNRMAILDMRQVPGDVEWDAPDLVAWRETGRRMHRRMIEQWPRFARTLSDYKREIWSHGLEGRWQDTFGTLLACADCLLHDCAPSQDSEMNDGFGREKEWVRLILPMLLSGKSEARSDVERCQVHLMSRLIPGAHGAAPDTLGQWLERAMAPDTIDDGAQPNFEKARARLKAFGLRPVQLDADGKLAGDLIPSHWESGYLAIAYSTCEPLASLFRDSEWRKGGWIQSLKKIPGTAGTKKVRFAGGNPDNAILVPIKAFRGDEG